MASPKDMHTVKAYIVMRWNRYKLIPWIDQRHSKLESALKGTDRLNNYELAQCAEIIIRPHMLNNYTSILLDCDYHMPRRDACSRLVNSSGIRKYLLQEMLTKTSSTHLKAWEA